MLIMETFTVILTCQLYRAFSSWSLFNRTNRSSPRDTNLRVVGYKLMDRGA